MTLELANSWPALYIASSLELFSETEHKKAFNLDSDPIYRALIIF